MYGSADFACEPVARMHLGLAGTVQGLTNDLSKAFTAVSTNVCFDGIAPGRYYVMAFIDSNTNGVRDAWESWGYANKVGYESADPYAPVSLEVTSSNAKIDSAYIIMEDTDVNQNKTPDCIEDMEGWTPPAAVEVATRTDSDGDGLTDAEEGNYLGTDPYDADTDGDGMPDGWEYWNGVTDALNADGEIVASGDVMAYAEESMTVIVLEDDTPYAITAAAAHTPAVGDSVAGLSLATVYRYGVGDNAVWAFGTNLTASVAGRIVSVEENVPVALMHAQVYARYGFDSRTCVPEGTVNTKEFTALDKYLVGAYFQAIGVTNVFQAAEFWENWTLKPGVADADADGIADGWELYTMFGPGVSDMSAATRNLSPWNYADRDGKLSPDGQLSSVQEYDGGKSPTDPYSDDTDKDGVSDADGWKYQIKSAESQLADYDNDGLSNWAEYLASKLTGKEFNVNNPCSVTTNRLDYFYQVEQDGMTKYVGECVDKEKKGLVADHDFMEDFNEDLYDVALLNRYSYDPLFDADGDGWSNFAEARAGTASDRSVTLSIDDYKYPEYPTPLIKASFVYTGSESLGGVVVLQAFRTGSANADAEWRSASQGSASQSQSSASQDDESQDDESQDTESQGTASESSTGNSKILGAWRNGTYRFMLSPSNIRPGSVNIQAKDLSFSYRDNPNNNNWTWPSWNYYGYSYYYDDVYAYDVSTNSASRLGSLWYSGTAAEARWFDIVIDRQRGDDAKRGDLIYNKYITGTTFEPRVVGWVDYETGLGEIDFSSIDGYFYKNVIADVDGSSVKRAMCYTLENSYFRVSHKSEFVTDSKRQVFYFSEPDSGMLLEGKYNFMAFIDANGDGAYTIGEPMGIVRDVNVGWDRVSDLVVELTDEAVTGARFSIAAQTNGATRVRINRTAINGVTLDRRRTVYVKTLDLTHGRIFSEADFIKDGEYDFDWVNLVADAQNILGIEASSILSATYAVYLDSGDPTPIYTFTRSFDAVNLAPAASGASTMNQNVVATAQPTLQWKGSAGYPAFALQIARDEGFADVVYSVTNLMPAATSDGCQFKPDLYVGYGLDDCSNYYWRVSQLNSKFTTNVWSAAASFRMQVDSSNADTGYGKVSAEVRYFGAATNDLTNVVVGVYENADFVSMPVARVRLSGGGKVSVLTNDLTQAFTVVATSGVGVVTLDGIKPGAYYLMAFIDANGNSVRDPWETWGYANKVGTGARDLYTPVPVTVVSTKSAVLSAFIVMEDTDVNQNWTPDCVDTVDLEGWKPSSEVNSDEPTNNVDTDGDGLTDSEEDDYGTDPRNPDTDGDGLPDGWEVENGTDPLFDDAGLAGVNDVMAYKEDTLKVMVTTNVTGGVTNTYRYVVDSRFEDGYGQISNTVYTVFEVNGQLYVGAPTNRDDVVKNYAYGYITTNVVVMHSAVYDFYGYDPTTAKPGTASVDAEGNATVVQGTNTVPFTVYLKYVTQQYYLPAVDSANAAKLALSVDKLDSNANYLPDGYELYIRYAVWHDPSVSYSDADARASYSDNDSQTSLDPYVADHDGDGMPTSWELWTGALDPLVNDATFVVPGDVMAYYEEVRTAVVVTNGVDEVATYLIPYDAAAVPKVGDDVTAALALKATYEYGDLLGEGTNVTLAAGRIVAVSNATVALVHWQVYDRFGFSPKTCVTDEDAVNTKPFTALDKYLLLRRFAALGLNDGADTVANFETWTLKPGDPDNNRDGVPDGWELYLMFGTNTTVTSVYDMKVSPFPVVCGMNAYDYVRNDTAVDQAMDGDGLSIIREYNGGVAPTDPWLKDTNGDGIDDKTASEYGIRTPEVRYNDDDNDGLDNFTEYLVNEVFDLGITLSPTNSMSDGETPDYFRKVGLLYLGEMLTDHDHMEDWWEKASGGRADPSVWDAQLDPDESGWSNYAVRRSMGDSASWVEVGTRTNFYFVTYGIGSADDEVFQATNAAQIVTTEFFDPASGWLTNAVSGVSTQVRYTLAVPEPIMVYGGHPKPVVDLTVYYNGMLLGEGVTRTLVVKAYSDDDMMVPDAVFTNTVKRGVNYVTLHEPASGMLKEGRNHFMAYMVADGGGSGSKAGESSVGEYEVGQPFGIVRDVDVGWNSARATIELAETSAVSDRIKLWTAGGDGGSDRVARFGLDQPTNTTTATIPQTDAVRVRVARLSADEWQMSDFGLDYTVVLDRTFTVESRDYIHEGDFDMGGEFDIGWSSMFSLLAMRRQQSALLVTNVAYAVVFGNGELDRTSLNPDNEMTCHPLLVTRRFESEQTRPTAVSVNGDSVCRTAQPTFRWRIDGEDPWASQYGTTYTAFRVKVWDATTNIVVYDSGYQRMPVADSTGVYSWTAPLYVDRRSPSGEHLVFSNLNNYVWSVYTYNAKFHTENNRVLGRTADVGTVPRTFRMNVTDLDTTSYSIDVNVVYAGPASDFVNHEGSLHVQAFTTPDFTGYPVAEAIVTNATTSVLSGVSGAQAKIVGLKAGTYYLRAYIDTDYDWTFDYWESWGYLSQRDVASADETASIFDPVSATVGPEVKGEPARTIYIEDRDTDGDGFPDVWEAEQNGNVFDKEVIKPVTGDVEFFAVNTNLVATLTSLDVLSSAKKNLLNQLLGNGSGAVYGLELLTGMKAGSAKRFASSGSLYVPVPVAEESVAIRSLDIDRESGEVVLVFGAETDVGAIDPAGAAMASSLYAVTYGAEVTVKVYHTETLAGEWKQVYTETMVITPSDGGLRKVKLPGYVDTASGFFKVEIENQ